MKRLILLWLAALLLSPQAMANNAEGGGVRRFALIVGANDGGPKRVLLQYATTDATAVAEVLTELGGLDEMDTILLLDPTRDDLSQAFDQLGDQVKEAHGQHARTEVVLYYSGHSDELGLRLGSELVPYSDLRRALFDIQSDVRLAILDSCASGTMTRTKGGSFQAPFLADDANSVKGYAILTSSSADEAAQESDRIGASFFTHSLVSGLRGAADNTGDGKVTLNEVYNYAFNDTLARTEKTQAGAQHPAYDIQLAGTGDLILTDLRQTASTLQLSETLQGRLFVRDSENRLVFEVRKLSGQAMSLALEPGDYSITIEIDGTLHSGQLLLEHGEETKLDLSDLTIVEAEAVALRGNGPEEEDANKFKVQIQLEAGDRLGNKEWELKFDYGVMPGINALAFQKRKADSVRFQVNLLTSFAPQITGLQASLLYNHVYGNMLGTQITTLGNYTGGDVQGVQASGAFSVAQGNVKGLQGSSAFNVAVGSMDGFQLAGGFNYAGAKSQGLQASSIFNVNDGEMSGSQLSGGFNVSTDDFDGFQGTGAFNVTKGRVDGAQLAGGFNVASKGGDIFQGAGGFNIAGGTSQGMQMAGGFNYAEDFQGFQLGVINISNHMTGSQVGVINIAREIEGMQLGVVNIARSTSGNTYGVLNFIKDGQHNLDVYVNEMGMTNVSLKLGGEAQYTLLNASAKLNNNVERWSYGYGFGRRFGSENAFLNVDAMVETLVDPALNWDKTNMVGRVRVYAGAEIFGPFAVFGGITYNAYLSTEDELLDIAAPSFGEVSAVDGDNVKINMWPGVIFGIQL